MACVINDKTTCLSDVNMDDENYCMEAPEDDSLESDKELLEEDLENGLDSGVVSSITMYVNHS